MTTSLSDNCFDIVARVNPSLLARSDRMFDGTPSGRMIELIQNARRAKATQVDVTLKDGSVTIHDDGAGIDDFASLLEMGRSDWSRKCEDSEDPAGIGFFCLAPGPVKIESGKWAADLDEAGWRGTKPVTVYEADDLVRGTRITYLDPQLTEEMAVRCAEYSGLTLRLNGREHKSVSFIPVDLEIARLPEFGVEVAVGHPGGRWWRMTGCNLSINHHGNYLQLEVAEIPPGVDMVVDFTGEPTPLRLMLPARTRMVENEAWDRFKIELQRQAFLHLKRKGNHRLTYEWFEKAKAAGVELPEADPMYARGLLYDGGVPSPPECGFSPGFQLQDACVPVEGLTEYDEYNAHLLAAYGDEGVADFCPVTIHKQYRRYSWADLPVIVSAQPRPGKVVIEGELGGAQVDLVDGLMIEARVRMKDGTFKLFCLDVPLAVSADHDRGAVRKVLINLRQENRVDPSDVFYLVDGYYEDGDTYDTQLSEFGDELDQLMAKAISKSEALRRKVCKAVSVFPWVLERDFKRKDLKAVTVDIAGGDVVLRFARGKPITLSASPKKTKKGKTRG